MIFSSVCKTNKLDTAMIVINQMKVNTGHRLLHHVTNQTAGSSQDDKHSVSAQTTNHPTEPVRCEALRQLRVT